MTETPNIKLKKPDETDSVDQRVFNENSDILDKEIATIQKTQSEQETTITKAAEQAAVNRSSLGLQRKNLFKNHAENQTKGGVTFTVENDMVYGEGETTAALTFNLLSKENDPISFDNDVIVSYNGTLKNLSANIRLGEDSPYRYINFTEDEKLIPAGEIISQVYIQQQTIGTNVSVKDFAVMIRYAEITDNTYEPYQPSLQEQIAALAEKIAELKGK